MHRDLKLANLLFDTPAINSEVSNYCAQHCTPYSVRNASQTVALRLVEPVTSTQENVVTIPWEEKIMYYVHTNLRYVKFSTDIVWPCS
jgi:hypothetical protein